MPGKPELLAPAGDFEKMRFAFAYGADAVYLGGKDYSLRKKAGNFSRDEIKKAVDYAHERGKRIYVTVNSYYHEDDLDNIPDFLRFLQSVSVDAVIVSDPGVVNIIRSEEIDIPFHISTQANTGNSQAVSFWKRLGAGRVILARENSFDEVRRIISNSPDMEFETFIHGAMCVSVSGRCLLSGYMANRDSNRGDCAQPCRWKYRLYYLEEDKRKGIFYPVYENDHGTYILNSKDLDLSARVPEMIDAGISSFKIEGRMKSVYYVAMVTRVYRQIIDEYIEAPDDFIFREEWKNELRKVSNRGYTEAAFDGEFSGQAQRHGSAAYERSHDILGSVTGFEDEMTEITVKNEFHYGQHIEVITPELAFYDIVHDFYIKDDEGNLKRSLKAPHGKEIYIRFDRRIPEFSIIRARSGRNV